MSIDPGQIVTHVLATFFGGAAIKLHSNLRVAQAAKEWRNLAEAREKRITDLTEEVHNLKGRIDALENQVQTLVTLNLKLQKGAS